MSEFSASASSSSSSSSSMQDDGFWVLLYYMYLDIPDVAAVADDQTRWCQELDLKGRIRVSDEGINGCLDGTRGGLEEYIKRMDEWDLLIKSGQKIHWKFHRYPSEESDVSAETASATETKVEGGGDSKAVSGKTVSRKEKRFRSLSVKHTKEVVSLDLDPEEIQKLKESKCQLFFFSLQYFS